MKYILLENLWLLAAAWFALQFVLIAIWSWRRTQLSARLVWLGFAALPVLITVSVTVVTAREKVIQLCDALAGFVDEGNVRAIAMRLTEDCTARSRDRQALLADLERVLMEYRVDEPSLSRFDVTFDSETEGSVKFMAAGRVRSPDTGYNWLATQWHLDVRLVEGKWQVSRIESRSGGTPGIGNVLDMLR